MKMSRRIVSIFLVAVMLLSCTFTVMAASGNYSKEAAEAAREIAKQMEAEGIVLLKNERNTLPLADKKVNVFGMGSVAFAIGGGGSGSVVPDEAIDFYTALSNAGIEYNEELLQMYMDWSAQHSVSETGQGLVDMLIQMVNGKIAEELPASEISNDILQRAKKYSDTAIFVITRTGAEMADVTVEDIKISDTEREILDTLDKTFDKVIVIFNTCNILQMDWLEDYDNVTAAMLVWTTGEVGADSIGKILSGEICPSGKLTDTVAYRIEDYPTTANFGNYQYSDEFFKYFINYEEGIYVGYRYFETFSPESVMYPFGYGLSYTTFDWDVTEYKADSNKISLTVKVTNTGKYAGKDVVQVYFSAPYYQGGIEKSAIELADYAKTDTISPGDSYNVNITFDVNDMASYDYKNAEAWVLDKGDYKIKIGHDVETFEKEYIYNVPETKIIKNDEVTGTEIKNLFPYADGNLNYLSRSNILNRTSSPDNYNAPESVKNCDTRPEPQTQGTVPKTGVVYEDGNIMLADVNKDPALWDKFLDQFTVSEMIDMICESGYKTAGLERLGVPVTVDNDGPATVKGAGGLLYKDSGVAYPAAVALACSWNDELAEAYGDSIGREANGIGTNIWYAPACNLHRSPMGGRNFEYYSEDPLISGKMAAAVTKGVQSHDVVVTVKHFVCNDQETNRQTRGLFTWVNEQAMREIYCEPFEIAVKEGGAKGIMSAYNRLGDKWCSGCPELLIDLLRNEWGFDGFVVSDAYINVTGANYMDPVLAVYARNDACLTSLWYFAEKLQMTTNMKQTYEKDPIGFGNALRLCTYDLCRVKMETKAFNPKAVTGNMGLVIKDPGENPNIDIPDKPQTPDSTKTDADNSSGNSSTVDKVKNPTTGFQTVSIISAACVAVAAAVATPIAYKASKKKKNKE